MEPITVFEGDDPVLFAMAETLLREAGIPFTRDESEPRPRLTVAVGHQERAFEILETLPEGPEVDDEAADSAWNQ